MTVKALKWSLPLALAALLTLPATAQSEPRGASRGTVVDAAADRFEAVGDYRGDRGRHRGHGNGRGHRKGHKYHGHHGKHRHHRWKKYHRPPVIWRHYGPGRYHHGHRHRGPHGRFELHFNIGRHH